MALSMGRSATSLSDTAIGSGRETPTSWPKRAGSLSRRRKVSVPDLSPMGAANTMATVQEAGLDSRKSTHVQASTSELLIVEATIPGRPPLHQTSLQQLGHERSISAPQHNLYQYSTGEFTNPRAPAPIPQRKYSMDSTQRPALGSKEAAAKKGQTLNASKSLSPIFSPGAPWSEKNSRSNTPPILEEDVPQPLNLPGHIAQLDSSPAGRRMALRLDTSVQIPEISPELKPEVPPKPSPVSTSKTPKTPKTPPRPWPMKHSASMGNLRTIGKMSAPVTDVFSPSTATSPEKLTLNLHARNASDTSILERGRPIKRTLSKKTTPKKSPTSATTSPKTDQGNWKLPHGMRPSEAVVRLPDSEKETLRKQATGQAEQFEILGSRNVASLSRV